MFMMYLSLVMRAGVLRSKTKSIVKGRQSKEKNVGNKIGNRGESTKGYPRERVMHICTHIRKRRRRSGSKENEKMSDNEPVQVQTMMDIAITFLLSAAVIPLVYGEVGR